MGGAAPDLSLQYSATYTYGSAKTLATCNENISLQTSLLDGSVAYCLPPCPGMEKIYPNPISIVITGHDRVTRNIYAALMESVFIQGSVSVEIMDTTKDVVSSSHTPPAALRKWRSLIIDKVLLSSEDTEAGLGTKTLVMEFSGALQKNTQGSSNTGTLENGGQTVIGVESVKGDYVALIVNGHDHSQVLKTVQAECDPLGRVCSVSGLQVLVDPGQGPVSNIFILLTNRHTAASSLFFLTDVHVRVHKVAPGTAIVMWDREPSVQEFIVRVVHASGETFGSVTVACSKRGSDCLATFNNLARGQYQAEVCYKRKSKVVLAFQFFMEDDIGIEYRK
ncbi:hypothetical protein E2C01_050132 [Portunus trituberculatus]|uniref:Uncharacterized protein n=1 Tax=Portunus trituberculatus TaxID=210409 RepID=A0A5B7GF87_PORTR|nr:hypothetical protein [Portunus trituberculatus]